LLTLALNVLTAKSLILLTHPRLAQSVENHCLS
jgi:hypothetical protein